MQGMYTDGRGPSPATGRLHGEFRQRMSAVKIAPPDDRTSRRLVSAEVARNERRFWIGLGCAFLLHALIILGTLASMPGKRLGEEKGAPEGVSVMIVDLADLESRSSVPSEAPTPGSSCFV